MPTVSVVLNCYNHEEYVAEAIESVLSQTLSDLELIIIDNGSTDGSRRVVERYGDARIRKFCHDENRSLSQRLNEGVAASRGEFVSILYSDDFFLPHKLEHQVGLFRTLPDDFGVVYAPSLGLNQLTGQKWQHGSLTSDGEVLGALLRHEGPIDMCAPLIRRECLLRYPYHDDLFTDGEAVLFRIAMTYRFKFDPRPGCVLRDHGRNLGKSIIGNTDRCLTMLDRLSTHSDLPQAAAKDLRTFRATLCLNTAWTMLRLGGHEMKWIRDRLNESLRVEPRKITHPRMLGALALSAAPATVRRLANRAADRLAKGHENRSYVQDFPVQRRS